jgi:hypothetical protein
MGRRKSPPPNIIKAPPAKTPTLTQVPSQSLATQTALNEASNRQQRLQQQKIDYQPE